MVRDFSCNVSPDVCASSRRVSPVSVAKCALVLLWELLWLPEMDGTDDRGGTSDSDSNASNNNRSHSAATSRKRFGVSRIVPEVGKKRVNYSKGDARRIMEEAVSLCEVMTLGYEVVFHGRRRSYAAHSMPSIMGEGVRCEASF